MEARLKKDPLAPFRTKREIWTPANLISFVRMLMVVPAILALSHGRARMAAAIFAIAFATDLLDGFVARRTGDVSEYGKIIDPLADKVFVGSVVIAMLVFGMVPVWFVAMILSRDIIILVAGMWAGRKFKVVLPSNYYGKSAVLTISLTLFLIVLHVAGIAISLFEGLSVILMIVSVFVYGARLLKLMREFDRAGAAVA